MSPAGPRRCWCLACCSWPRTSGPTRKARYAARSTKRRCLLPPSASVMPEWGDRGLLPRVVPIAGRERRAPASCVRHFRVSVSAPRLGPPRIREYNRVVRIREILWLEAGWTVHA